MSPPARVDAHGEVEARHHAPGLRQVSASHLLANQQGFPLHHDTTFNSCGRTRRTIMCLLQKECHFCLYARFWEAFLPRWAVQKACSRVDLHKAVTDHSLRTACIILQVTACGH